MNFKRLTAVLTLAAATVVLPTTVETAHAQQQQQQQGAQQEGPGLVFSGDGLDVEIWAYDEKTNEMGGYLVMGQNTYPFLATLDGNNGQINGKFAVSQGEQYPFNGQLAQDASRLTFTTGGKTYNLVNRQVGQSQAQTPAADNPLDQQKKNTAPNPLDNTGGSTGGAPAGNAVTPDLDAGFAALQAGDGKTAYAHLEPLAAAGDVNAARLLGVMFHYGQAGMAVDGAAAAKYYEIAAAENDVQSLGNLGILYRDGIGVEKDAKLAGDYLSRAANLDDPSAQLAYGGLFWVGEMIEQNDVEALAWWILAADNGNAPAAENVQELRRSLPADTVKKADARAAELRKQVQKILQIAAAAGHRKAVDDIRNSAPASKLAEIEAQFAK